MSNEIGIWEYIKDLRDKYKVYTNKQKKFLSHINIYVHNLQVYKIAIWPDPNKKNGKRVGVDKSKIVVYDSRNDTNVGFVKLKKELDGSDVGYKMFIYNVKQDDVKCFEGEYGQQF